jgi:hypothetical protein
VVVIIIVVMPWLLKIEGRACELVYGVHKNKCLSLEDVLFSVTDHAKAGTI